MKKYLLSLLIVGLTFIGFSYGELLYSYTCSAGGYCVNPGNIPCDLPNQDITISVSPIHQFTFRAGQLVLTERSGVLKVDNFCGSYRIFLPDDDNFPVSITISNDYTPPILPGGNSALTPVVSGLNSLVVEILPYLLYIGLGIIVVIVGFVAIRWLINWTQAKLRGTFSSGRKRR